MATRFTVPALLERYKKGDKIVCLTAYDALMASLVDQAGVEVILVGDSLGNVVQGVETTLPVELDDIRYHLRAVLRGSKSALVIADLPFGSYQVSAEQALQSSIQLMKDGAGAVKLEGEYTEAIQAITKAGIPVMGHLGMTPQSYHQFGGFKIQGKGEQAEALVASALRVQESGAFAIVLELIPAELAKKITEALTIPTIGIGAGPGCSGQIQVLPDILGLYPKGMKHAKKYLEGHDLISKAIAEYAAEVRTEEFPTREQSF